MPGTHLLPPNLLKLFAPRPPLPYKRPVDRDLDRIRPKAVSGVAQILERLKEEKEETLFSSANKDGEEDEQMEEGEEPTFTHAEEVKRQILREERKAKKAEEFKKSKEACVLCFLYSTGQSANYPYRQTCRRCRGRWRPIQNSLHRPPSMYNTFSAAQPITDIPPQHKTATETDLRREFEGYGNIERVRIVRDKNGRSRGYAFIVYERERDMKGKPTQPCDR
jgi:U1 small nuclear ribonucleoprotein 70kDa